MALTFTVAGLQAQIQLVVDALDAGDSSLAWKEWAKAHAVVGGLPAEVSSDGVTVKTSTAALVGLRVGIEKLEAEQASSTRRVIRAGFRHGS